MNPDNGADQLPGAMSSTQSGIVSITDVARDIGRSVAYGIIERIGNFPDREKRLFDKEISRYSLPEQILWDGLGEEAAPIFVVYKLVHEAFSNAPRFFRAALVSFMAAQPERFSACFSRETIWAAMAARPSFDLPEEPLLHELREALQRASRLGIWWRSDEEITREAEALAKQLDNGKFRRGFLALKALQSEKARGIACGKLLLAVPARLAAYAEEVVALAEVNKLPPLEELHARVDEFARDKETDARHESIPLDLLYTTTEDHFLKVRILVRAKAGKATLENLRRRSLFTRYFLRKAFAGYAAEHLDVKLAPYLDDAWPRRLTHEEGHLFHREELVGIRDFWEQLCPSYDPDDLFSIIKREAASVLQKEGIVQRLRKHFNDPRHIGCGSRQIERPLAGPHSV